MANNPHVALTALLHKLCLDTFQHTAPGVCLEASVRHVFFSVQPADLNDSPFAKAVREANGGRSAQLIYYLRKAEMTKEAERLLSDTGWLPEPLWMADVGDVTVEGDATVDAE